MDGVYTTITKHAVGRTRPDGSNTLSFPSGHTSSAFAMATVANGHFGPKVGNSRLPRRQLDRGLAHPVEQAPPERSRRGATLGYIVGRTVVRKNGEAVRGQKQIMLVPATDACGTGVGAGVNISW